MELIRTKTVIAAMSLIDATSIILVLVLLFLGFKLLESNWSYRISKPYAWEHALKNGSIPNSLKNIERAYRDKVRFYTFWFQIERLKKENVGGAFAELGVYKGETARMIHEMDPNRMLHLFDTFTGFDERDMGTDTRGESSAVDFSDTHVEGVRKFIGGNDNVIFHAGYFPETSANLHIEYAFVHLDADLYSPTLAALKYFYPRLAKGGVMIVHDYNHNWEGVRKAIKEFTPSIPEGFIEIPDWQGSIIIVKNR